MRSSRVAVLFAAFAVLAACSLGDDRPPVEVTVDEVAGNVLAFSLDVTTSGRRSISARATSADGHVVDVPSLGAPATRTEVPLVGLRAASRYIVEVTATADDGATSSVRETVETGELPDDLPRIDVVSADVDRMARGVTLFNVIRPFNPPPEEVEPGDEPELGLLLAIDEHGEIVWYYRSAHPVGAASPVAGGLLLEVNDTIAREIDLLGRTRTELAGTIIREKHPVDRYGRTVASEDAIPVEVDSFHHEVSRLPSGNLLTLSTELLDTAVERPRCGEDPATFSGRYQIISDVVVELDPEGDVVNRWPIADVADPVTDPATPELCPSFFPSAVPTWMYQEHGGIDWTHGNAVSLDEERNALIVSLRHLNAVVAIRYADDDEGSAGELLWRLGPDGDLQLLEGEWQYHQHAPEVQDDGSILVYDNGNTRPGTHDSTPRVVATPTPPAGALPSYSRVVLYEVEDRAGTARQRWEYRSEVDGEPAFAFFLGDVDRLPTGAVLIADGGLAGRADGISAQLTEVLPQGSSGGEVVWRIRLFDGHHIYRAERLASLYEATASR